MKILLAGNIFIPEVGGPAVYISKLCTELENLGHKVMVISYSDKAQYDFDNQLPYAIKRIARKNILSDYYRYFREVLKNLKSFDVIYSFDYFSSGIPSLIAAKICRKKIIIRNGGDIIWERYLDKTGQGLTLEEFYKKKIYKNFFVKFFIAKIVFKNSDKLIFSTKFQADIFAKYYKIGNRKIRYVNNPLPAKTTILNKTNHEPGKEIIWAGRMIVKNNLKTLIKVFGDLNQTEHRLILIGEGPQKVFLKKEINETNRDQIIIMDKLSNKDLVEKITNCYAVAFPSYTDISPNLVLECLSVNVPFILTKEHGFDWLRGKVLEFDPMNEEELKQAFLKLFDKDFYWPYKKNLSAIDYSYGVKQAAEDTLKVLVEAKSEVF
jgi:glycosyltransferase involved in cell wall biosynthesis